MEQPEKQIPDCFVVFPPDSVRPRRFTRVCDLSYDEHVWDADEWLFFDNVRNETAVWWYRNQDCEVFTKTPIIRHNQTI